MAESKAHKAAKSKAAGKQGKKEVPLKDGKRLDAATPRRATEVERGGTAQGLYKAAQRLKSSRRNQKVLQVPEKDMSKAADAMRKAGVSGTVKNMNGSKRRFVDSSK